MFLLPDIPGAAVRQIDRMRATARVAPTNKTGDRRGAEGIPTREMGVA